jgi:glutamate---cysteine ligase / carboxylate-amine ligase
MLSDHSSGLLFGLQLELAYALVGQGSLDALPRADEVLSSLSGERMREVEAGNLRWINRGPLHLLRLGMRHGADSLAQAEQLLVEGLISLREHATAVEAGLLPTGMHPWLRASDARRWPHGGDGRDEAVLALYGKDRHGWANQQGLRLSLPFASETRFRELFSSLRFALPLLPALAASSPFVEGHVGPARNCRLAARRDLLEGRSLVPPAYEGREAYQAELVEPLRRERNSVDSRLLVFDLCGHVLQADFDAGLIHLYALDAQECLQADLALCAFTAATAGWLMHETAVVDTPWPSARLAELVECSLIDAEVGVIRDTDYLELLGYPERGKCRFRELLQFLLEDKLAQDPAIVARKEILTTMRTASLATRMVTWLEQDRESWGAEELFHLYRDLVQCSETNESYG